MLGYVQQAPGKVMATTMIIVAWRVGSVLNLNANFMPKNCSKGGNCVKIATSVLEKGTQVRGRNQGQCSQQGYGSRISMVHRCGQKPGGEKVSVSLVFALGLHYGQTRYHKYARVGVKLA